MKWTPEQERGVKNLGKSILMSAAAGSGKTAVLAGRCVHLVCDADPPCSVEDLLVVTFTNRAADQMRERIARRLAARLQPDESSPDLKYVPPERVRRELALLPRAAISTLASFCVSVLRRHFHAAGVDPRFSVLDADQARLLKRQTVGELFEARFEAEDDDFVRLIDLYADGNDLRLRERVLACWEMLTSVLDPAQWRRDALELVREAAEKPLKDSALGGQWLDVIDSDLASAEQKARDCQGVLRRARFSEPKVANLAAWVEQFADEATARRRVMHEGGLDALAKRCAAFDPGRKPGVSKALTEEFGLEAPIEAMREAMTGKELVSLLATPERTWRQIMAQVVGPTEQFLALVEQFDAEYARAKAAIRSLDFADLERKTLLLLQDEAEPGRPSEIAFAYRRRFSHVLVDEFQDINAMQARLLGLLSREDSIDPGLPPNLFTVGDVKQSIYRFRLADPAMFLERAKVAAEQAERFDRIDLQQNFRSRGPLLEAINSVFMRLLRDEKTFEIDYGDHHQLIANPAYPPAPEAGFPGSPIEIHVLEPGSATAASTTGDTEEEGEATGTEVERIEREAAFIAGRIREFQEEGRQIVTEAGDVQPLRFAHVAVLLRSLKFNSERLVRMLRQLGIPARSEVGTGFFEALEIRDVVSLLHVLDNRRQDVPLAAVLRSPLMQLENVEDLLARIRLWARGRPGLERAPFFEAALAFADDADAAGAPELRARLDRIEGWRLSAYRKPLADLLWQIYTKSGYLAYVEGLPDGLQRSRNLLELHRRAGSFDRFQRRGLGAFMLFIENLQEGGDLAQPPVLGAGEDAVRIMSVHAAKGLEFPVVFLADCGRQHNRRDLSDKILIDRDLGVALPGIDQRHGTWFPSLPRLLAQRRIDRLGLAEELRVLYVAMTRAREHLVCVGTTTRSGSRTAADVVASWAGHAGNGALPTEAVLQGRSFLEWLGMAGAGQPERLAINVHESAEIDDLLADRQRRTRADAVDARWKNLGDVPVAAPGTEVKALVTGAQQAIGRLMTPYPFADMTRLPAAAGVTTLAKDPAPSIPAAPAFLPAAEPAMVRLERPQCLAPKKASAVETGTATHVALRLLNFSDAANVAAIERQVAQMVERHQLAPEAAATLDLDALLWLAGTWVGDAARDNAKRLWRELPIRLPSILADEPSLVSPVAPLDRLLLRGQIDLAIDASDSRPAGWWLVDYKTDRVQADGDGSGRSIAALTERYRPQLELYARGLAQISGLPVTRMGLALLSARRMVDIPPEVDPC